MSKVIQEKFVKDGQQFIILIQRFCGDHQLTYLDFISLMCGMFPTLCAVNGITAEHFDSMIKEMSMDYPKRIGYLKNRPKTKKKEKTDG